MERQNLTIPTTSNQPRMLSLSTANRCLRDESFYSLLPEFTALKMEMVASSPTAQRTGGCSSCAQKKRFHNIGIKFMYIVQSLSPTSLAKFKHFVGAEKLMYQGLNKSTNKFEVRII